jgi:class 3 adenylate cyclase
VVDALHCASEVQLEMVERNAAIPTDSRIEFLIGINVATSESKTATSSAMA